MTDLSSQKRSLEPSRTIHGLDLTDDIVQKIRCALGIGEGGKSKFIDSPFSVTVLGGIVLSLLTLSWQCNADRAEREHASAERLHDIKLDTMRAFSECIGPSLYEANRWKTRELWIRDVVVKQDGPPDEDYTGRYRDGRNYVETRSVYEEAMGKYFNRGTPDQLCARVQAVFCSDEVLRLASELDKTMDAFVDADAFEDVRETERQASKIYQELLAAMWRELRSGEEK